MLVAENAPLVTTDRKNHYFRFKNRKRTFKVIKLVKEETEGGTFRVGVTRLMKRALGRFLIVCLVWVDVEKIMKFVYYS